MVVVGGVLLWELAQLFPGYLVAAPTWAQVARSQGVGGAHCGLHLPLSFGLGVCACFVLALSKEVTQDDMVIMGDDQEMTQKRFREDTGMAGKL